MRPGLYTRLVQILESPQVTMADAAAVIEQDTGISAKLLQVVNSAFFGQRQRVVDIRTAVASLGLELVKALVLSAEMRKLQTETVLCEGYSVEAADRHSLLAAQIARRLVNDRASSQDAFSAARLKEAGALVLMSRLPEDFRRILNLTRDSGRPIWECEVEVLGVSHAEIRGLSARNLGVALSDRRRGRLPAGPPAIGLDRPRCRPGGTRGERAGRRGGTLSADRSRRRRHHPGHHPARTTGGGGGVAGLAADRPGGVPAAGS